MKATPQTLFSIFFIFIISFAILMQKERTPVKLEGKLELLTGSESQIALYLVKYTSY